MQKHPKPLDVKTPSELESLLGKERARRERLELSKLFKFLTQDNNPHVRFKSSIEDIKFKKFYENHKKAIDKLHFILTKYGINPEGFIRFSLSNVKVYIPELIIKPDLFKMYADHKYNEEKYSQICSLYMKSVEFIARKSLELRMTPINFIMNEFVCNHIAYEYISGTISKYFLVTIKNFKELYEKLDGLNKDELRIIYGATDELRTMVNEAVFKETGRYPRPISDSNEALKKLIKEKLTRQSTNQEN